MVIRRRLITLVLLLSFITGCTFSTQTSTPLPTRTATLTLPSPTIQLDPTVTTASATPLPTASPTPRIDHLATPGDAPDRFESQIIDPDDSMYAGSRKVVAGEAFDSGNFERPFNAGAMNLYSPELDILSAGLYRTDDWVFVTITLASVPKGKLLSGMYGVEIDIDVDGRGDVLVTAKKPGLMWSVEGVSVWRDANHDVGGTIPIYADPSKSGDGYEQLIFDSGKGFDSDAAWARIDPDDFSSVQIAFKKAIIDNDNAFLWGAWAQDEIKPALFDYNDHFTLEQAGSPLPSQAQYYPLKALANVDNTCRWAVGFEPTGSEPGLCPIAIGKVTESTGTTIRGLVWYDRNKNLVQDPGEPGFENMTLNLTEGDCGQEGKLAAIATTGLDGTYVFNDVPPARYCLTVIGPIPTDVSPVEGTGPQTIDLKPGSTVRADFAFVIYSR